MRVAFDHQAFSRQAYGGVSRYFFHLIRELTDLGCVDVKVFSPWYINYYLKSLPGELVQGNHLKRYPPGAAPMLRWMNNISAKSELSQWRPDVIHETYFSSRPMGPEGVSGVVTVYDMIHERFPEQFWAWDKTRQNKMRAVDRASHVICISESTRRDLIDILHVPPEKTTVVHLAYEKFNVDEVEGVPGDSVMRRPYILYVGHRGGYKNFQGLLKAVAASAMLSRQFDIVCFGGGGLSKSEGETIRALSLEGRVRQFSGSDGVLGMMYRDAAAFVYPSIYEGFGLPPLEAMAHECPVVCSNSSSLPEVVGESGEYFDPLDMDSMRAALERVLFSSDRRNELIALGKQRLSCFSWKKCAEETLRVYEKIG